MVKNLVDYLHYQLCYIAHNQAHFANVTPDKVWGDDWNDAPYEHNAGQPYTRPESYDDVSVYYWHNVYETPADKASGNSWVSVENINSGQCAWLLSSDSKHPPIMAGCTLQEFIELVRNGGEVYIPFAWLVI